MSNITGEEGSFSSGNTGEEVQQLHHGKQQQQQFHGSLPSDSSPSLPAAKKKRNLPGTPVLKVLGGLCRRDSFITHRAFCDALAEENSKVNQGLMNSMGSNLQAQMPHELLSSMPNSTSMAMTEFNNNYDNKSPMKSLPSDLVAFKPMNMAGGMFSTSSGTLFGGQRNNAPSSSSGLQLSSNSPASFNGQGQVSGTAHMSATALLQKAAQMGATASNSINSPMMQKSFVSSMAGPMMQSPGNNSYENFQTQPDQTTMVGITPGGAYGNAQMLQKGPQEVAQMFGSGPANSPTMSDMGMFSDMLMGNDQQNHAGFIKNTGNQDNDGTMGWNTTGPSRFGGLGGPAGVAPPGGGSGGNDMLTVDFLGIGGGSRPPNVHEQQQRMQMANPFQQLSHAESDMEKPIWDV
uniref:BIRD-IDD transcription factor fourth C2HC zinc finger domain-containing protein n=1 Tax=Daucus carota subsp. sativus TaxID=79200 RepID=A0A161Y382_DAUCS